MLEVVIGVRSPICLSQVEQEHTQLFQRDADRLPHALDLKQHLEQDLCASQHFVFRELVRLEMPAVQSVDQSMSSVLGDDGKRSVIMNESSVRKPIQK